VRRGDVERRRGRATFEGRRGRATSVARPRRVRSWSSATKRNVGSPRRCAGIAGPTAAGFLTPFGCSERKRVQQSPIRGTLLERVWVR
jgi:hypothetical protein